MAISREKAIRKIKNIEPGVELVDLYDIFELSGLSFESALVLSRMYGGEFIYVPIEMEMKNKNELLYVAYAAKRMMNRGLSINYISRALKTSNLKIKKALGVFNEK